MQKKISMNKQEIAQGLSPFVMMAFVDAQNLETGFLTRHCINKLTKEQIMGFSMETEKIINQLSHQLEQVADGNPQITNVKLYFSTYLTKLLKLYTSY